MFNCVTNIATHSFIVQVIAAVTRLMTLTVILDPAIHPPRHIDVTYIWVLIMSLRRNNAGTTRLS